MALPREGLYKAVSLSSTRTATHRGDQLHALEGSRLDWRVRPQLLYCTVYLPSHKSFDIFPFLLCKGGRGGRGGMEALTYFSIWPSEGPELYEEEWYAEQYKSKRNDVGPRSHCEGCLKRTIVRGRK